MSTRPLKTGNDAAWWDVHFAESAPESALDTDVERKSYYIVMRDGVEIAIDCYLPENMEFNAKIPSILVLTRYCRALEYNWPFNHFIHGRFDEIIEHIVKNGYAWIYADARGSGASYGRRTHPYSEDEIHDALEIVDWIISQKWSNGRVGTWGSSYAGGCALHILRENHPAVKASMPIFTLFDLYLDIIPGGVRFEWFIREWETLCRALDGNRINTLKGIASKVAVNGIRPVDSDPDTDALTVAVSEHGENVSISSVISEIVCRDDKISAFPGATIDDISPFQYIKEINLSDAAVYLYTGWFDASFILSSINCFKNLDVPNKKLTIGPWDHGGWHNISPYAATDNTSFDKKAEIIRFFDCYLKGIENGISLEHPVHYFTMGEEQWKTAADWPPPGSSFISMYFNDGNTLKLEKPEYFVGFDTYLADYSVGTGRHSRWDSIINLNKNRIFYPDRKYIDSRLLCYTTAPLDNDIEVTGHPIITLFVSSSANDGNFFVYLEDVDKNGKVTYVTEGLFRALHRKPNSLMPPYSQVQPYNSFRREDAQTLEKGSVEKIVFSLYPTSYLFKKGHSIRIALSAADKDHFANIPEVPPLLTFFRNSRYPSHIDLPVMEGVFSIF